MGKYFIVAEYYKRMEFFSTVVLIIVAIAAGLGFLIFGIRGTRESQARDGRTYRRGRI